MMFVNNTLKVVDNLHKNKKREYLDIAFKIVSFKCKEHYHFSFCFKEFILSKLYLINVCWTEDLLLYQTLLVFKVLKGNICNFIHSVYTKN